MAVVIEVGFPFGSVHATPWGTHVNEGAVEWPLSPWRLLRALVATWKTRCAEFTDDQVLPVLEALAEPPVVWVAPRVDASIRTYLPAEGHRSGAAKPDTDLVVDAFAAVERGRGLAYRWEAELSEADQLVLARLVESLPYLGRAESVCEARATFPGGDGPVGDGWLVALPDDEGGVGRRVLAPTQPLDLDALCTQITPMRKAGRLTPPASCWVRYEVPAALADVPRAARRQVEPPRRHLVRFALRSREPVSVRHTLVVGERLRAAAMHHYRGAIPSVLSGKDADGKPLRDGNTHAHWIPLDLDGDGLLDTAVVWALPAGFGREELAAFGAVNWLRFHRGDGMRDGRTLGVGLEAAVTAGQQSRRALEAVFGRSERWRSATPFLPQRHRARDDVDTWLRGCVERELRARDIVVPFELIPDRSKSWGSYRRYRSGEGIHRARPGFGFELRFAEPVDGPISIGAFSHFGMGRFETA